MAEKNNAVCSVCGKSYHVCLSCRDSIQLTPYKKLCCSPECYKTFQVVKGFSTGVYTKDEFKSKLKNLDLNNLEDYKESIKVLIKDTLKEEKEEIVEETIIERPIVSRRKNYKTNDDVVEAE